MLTGMRSISVCPVLAGIFLGCDRDLAASTDVEGSCHDLYRDA